MNVQDFCDEYKNKVGAYGLGLLREAMKDLKPEEVVFFNKMWKSVEEVPIESRAHAYSQIMSTTSKRKKE